MGSVATIYKLMYLFAKNYPHKIDVYSEKTRKKPKPVKMFISIFPKILMRIFEVIFAKFASLCYKKIIPHSKQLTN